MKRLGLTAAAALLLSAAGPAKSFLTMTPLPDFGTTATTTVKRGANPPSGDFTAAPTPNQDIVPPTPPKQSKDAALAPSFFTRKNQTQGDGYLPSSSLQAETNSKARPGAGINLSMPLQ